tara:strand:- start:332 stop:517 length:186 start_codon:yes stop_codon:yes gene_type:complete
MITDYNKNKRDTASIIQFASREKVALRDKLIDTCNKHRGLSEIDNGYYLVDSKKFTIKQKD